MKKRMRAIEGVVLRKGKQHCCLGVCDRTFRRYRNRYDEGGLDALVDKRLVQVSHRRAPVDEVMRLTE